MTAVRPTNIQLADPSHLLIEWSDGQKRRYAFREILDRCPCASCREKRTGTADKQDGDLLPVIKPEEAQPLKLVEMKPVGSYAYSIHFNHGCRNGIFTFDHLRRFGKELK